MDWDRCLQTLEGHNESVYQAIVSPDFSLIASRGYQKILIWRSHAGTCIHEINALANAIAFSPDGRFLYSVLSNGQVETRETDTWTCKAVMKVDIPTGATRVSNAAFSHDCKLVAVAFDTSIEIRSISTPGDFAKSIKWDRPYTTSVMFSPDSAYIAALSSDILNIWPIRGGQPNLIEYCSAAAYSPDSSLMALALERTIEIRRIDGGSLKPHRKFFVEDRHKTHILTFSHDAALLAISSGDSKLEIWSTEAGKRIWTANDHTYNISSVLFSHDSEFLISSSIDGTLRMYSVNHHQSLDIHEGNYREIGPITISPDSSLVLLEPGGDNQIWQIMHADSGICAGEFDRDRLQSEPTFTHNSSLAVIKGGTAEIWHSDGHQSVQSLDGLGPYPSGLHAACFSEDFTLVAGILDDKSLRIWQMNTGECICEIDPAVPYGYEPNTLCFSPDTSRIACSLEGEDEDDIFVWQVESRALVQRFTISKGITSFALSNTKLAAAPFDAWPKMSIWSLETGDILQHCENESISTIYELSFSDDSTILVGVLSQTISIWNADTGAHVQTYHVGLDITHLSFEPNDNSRLRTNLGRIKLKDFAALSKDAANNNQVQSWYYDKLHITNNDDDHNGGSWITYNGENLLWLPANYRGDHGISRAVSESLAAIVSWRSGQHTFIGFDIEKIPGWYHDIYT
jgi:WD40 repeat protein